MLFSTKSLVTLSTLLTAVVAHGYNGTDGHKHQHNGTSKAETRVRFVTVVVSKAVATVCVTTGTQGSYTYTVPGSGSGSVSTIPTSSLSISTGSGNLSIVSSSSISESASGSSSVPTERPSSSSVYSSKTYSWGNSSTISISSSSSKPYSISVTSNSQGTGNVPSTSVTYSQSTPSGSSSSQSTASLYSTSSLSYLQFISSGSSSSLSSSSVSSKSYGTDTSSQISSSVTSSSASQTTPTSSLSSTSPTSSSISASQSSSTRSQTSSSPTSLSASSSSSPSLPSSSSQSSSSSQTSSVSTTSSSSRSSSSSSSVTSSSSKFSSSSSSSASSESSSSSLSSTSSKSSSTSSSTTSSSLITSTTSKSSTSSTSSKTSSTSSTSSATPSPTACSGYWMESISHQGIAPFNAAPGSYQVFRNVKDFGAVGDGKTDDTVAINNAITFGNRCAPGACNSTTTTPAVVYFPNGTYLVSNPGIIDYYYTQIIGNPIPGCMPTIKASAAFTSRWVIDGDQYVAGGALGYGATNVFWRQIRNFIIDMTSIPSGLTIAAIHWPTAQATSLQNIVIKMSQASGNQHQGVFIESGSGGFMNDITFYGGFQGLFLANQQFTMRNLTFYNVATAIYQGFDWGWTYKGISINNCQIGIDMTSLSNIGNQSVGSITLIDSDFTNTPVGISTVHTLLNDAPATGGSLIIENLRLKNVPTTVQGAGNSVLLAGSTGSTTVAAWGQGHAYGATGPTSFQGSFTPTARVPSLLSGTNYYSRSKPQYENLPASAFLSVRSQGAAGDGKTDDSVALQNVLNKAALLGQVVYFDAGDYLVTTTIYFPPGVRVTGETYPVVLSSGPYFNDMAHPKPVVQVGKPGEVGTIEWSDMIVSTQGAQAGAILIEWNLASSTPAGMWDVHTRVGGFAGSNLQLAECPVTSSTTITAANVPKQCIAAFMSMHVTSSASGLYMENCWLWVADHDVEDPLVTQITIYAGRGLLIESAAGNNWLYGTAVEHHSLYQYGLSNTGDIFMGFIQTETAYYQPNPDATVPFTTNAAYSDPTYVAGQSGWGLHVSRSHNVAVYGAGLYSFFSNNNVHCSNQGNGETCQSEIFSVDAASAQSIAVYGYSTVGATNMITLGGNDIAIYGDNLNGFVDTIALFREY